MTQDEPDAAADFNDHCWKDVVPAEVQGLYAQYHRPLGVGPAPALLCIDLYDLAYQGGPSDPVELFATYPSSCGRHAHSAIAPTLRLLAAARGARLPVFFSTRDCQPGGRPKGVEATRRRRSREDPSLYEIRAEFGPLDSETVIRKQRASAFFGTPLAAHLTQLGVRSVIILGQTTSGCVRASAVDAFSHGFKVALAEDCCFDRNPLSHKVNLFDLHHKYADVLRTRTIVDHLAVLASEPGTPTAAAT